MKSIIFALFAIALASSLRYENTFNSFEARYGKNYINDAERSFRAKVFAYNMDWVNKINAEGHPYTVGATIFADMTNQEFATSKMCGCMLKPTMTKPATPIMDAALEEVDW
ncbi:thiol protease, partial [Blastocystis sp. subtype 4]|uniref:thiol protease n=1 Tax=Blastocystis sp. subtype 4 TaxID=944170 RepID=UPI0007113615